MSSKSPLKGKPLRVPGESLDEEIDRCVTDSAIGYYIAAALLCSLAAMEWFGDITHAPRRPILFSIMAAAAVTVAVWRIWVIRGRVRQLKQGRDGERVVGQFLERLREAGGQVFHDIPAEGFNLDHVVISPHGLYAVETKTYSKPWSKATITVDGDCLRIAGRIPDRNPIEQVAGAARWLECLLQNSTGKRFAVRGVVAFPGWFVEQRSARGPVWVLEPKALPAFIEKEPVSVPPTDVALAAFHLSRYVRSQAEKLG
jgi:Nuclease-related domain